MQKEIRRKIDKRGLSPIIATTLLILLAVILALIVFFWAKSFISEKAQKNLGGGEKALDSFCEDISFTADITSTTASIENKGNVPIYGIEIRKKTTFSSKLAGKVLSINAKIGETVTGTIDNPSIASGDNVLVLPIIMGEDNKIYTCDEQFGVKVKVN